MEGIKKFFNKATAQAHFLAFRDTCLVIFFTLLPLILGVFQMKITSSWLGLDIFYKRGEFFLYALSLLVSSYQVYNHFQFRYSDLKSVFSVMSVILLVLCAC